MKRYLIATVLILSIVSCGKSVNTSGLPAAPTPPSNCTVTAIPNGATITCPDGSTETITDGAPGSIVTPVKLCKDVTLHYPDSFPEYGLCMNDNLYAVFWTGKSAWWTLLTPGYYESTSTSAPCSFTVISGCKISN